MSDGAPKQNPVKTFVRETSQALRAYPSDMVIGDENTGVKGRRERQATQGKKSLL